MRILNGFLALLFFCFAVVQYNDPDPWAWIVAYTAVALLCTAAVFGHGPKAFILLLAGIVVVWMATLLPGFLDWLRGGMPSITGSMQAADPYIEVVREFLGLFLALLALLHLFRLARGKG